MLLAVTIYTFKLFRVLFFFKVVSMPRVEPDRGLEFLTQRSTPEQKSRVRCLTN